MLNLLDLVGDSKAWHMKPGMTRWKGHPGVHQDAPQPSTTNVDRRSKDIPDFKNILCLHTIHIVFTIC